MPLQCCLTWLTKAIRTAKTLAVAAVPPLTCSSSSSPPLLRAQSERVNEASVRASGSMAAFCSHDALMLIFSLPWGLWEIASWL